MKLKNTDTEQEIEEDLVEYTQHVGPGFCRYEDNKLIVYPEREGWEQVPEERWEESFSPIEAKVKMFGGPFTELRMGDGWRLRAVRRHDLADDWFDQWRKSGMDIQEFIDQPLNKKYCIILERRVEC